MIVGIVALLTVLFFGGPNEMFYVDDIEKGIKKNIEEKERKKEILADFKFTKSISKEYEKERKKGFKEFKALYNNNKTTKNQLESFFNSLQKNRGEYQNKMIDQRILIFEKIESQEWHNIIESSITVLEKRTEKIEKKALKSKESYRKTQVKIESVIVNNTQKESILKGLESFINTSDDLEKTLSSINASENKILADKNSSKEDLLELISNDSAKRNAYKNSIINFHLIVKENSSDEVFINIMKTFFKESEINA
ncbi:hypothetical protein SAMN06265371_101409 [Lutibacter agarilyticus]|uniref:Uncharacterized protein n=1 Tax=Lutibacter agarilyticus TaxID=1109740 RepID=A0A238VJ72_9FLAO|nr:hypothetical protein [Lutibacter agarilyticus]SNR33559.1 hypothetical protein SAMN06265371_101409 [Lutibacter agarilyticus]